MAANQTAYMSTDPKVIKVWEKWLAEANAVRDRRAALSDSMGRHLMVQRKGFGGGTRVVGFERFESDKDGDLIADGALIVKRGSATIGPNRRRKAGKEMETHLTEYDSPEADLPGMPVFHMFGSGYGISVGTPVLFRWKGAVYALWGCDDVPVNMDRWRSINLSTYYAAREAFNAEQEKANAEEG